MNSLSLAVRRHKCSDCAAIYECATCTKAMRESLNENRFNTRSGYFEGVRMYGKPHTKLVPFICPECRGEKKRRA